MQFPKPSYINGELKGWPWIDCMNHTTESMHTEWPKISIITPSYNQAQFLEQTIRSVLLQHYPNLEFIIIDGASTDDSINIIKKYSNWITYWISEPDSGQSDALNKGFKLATGEIIAWINSDDFYEEGALLKIAEIYKKSSFDLLCGACEMVDEAGKPIQRLFTKKISYTSLIRYWKPHFCPPQPSMFFQKKILAELGSLNTSLNYAMDYDLWLRASKKFSFTVIDDNISYYRVHSHSKTGSEGGLRKFIPEWKMLIKKSLEHKSIFTKIYFYTNESWFRVVKAKNIFFNKYYPKNMLRRWLVTKKA